MKHSDFHTREYSHLLIRSAILSVLSVFCVTETSAKLFTPGKEYVYSYDATSSTGVLLPATASSGWGIHGKLVIQASEDSVLMQLQSLKTSTWNGPSNEQMEERVHISDEAMEITKPFRVMYNLGNVQNFSVETEPIWATNIKKSIAGIMQLDVINIRQEPASAFNSLETNHYGQCNIEYVVTPSSADEKLVRKSVDPRTCRGHPDRTWSNVPRMICPNNDQNPVLKSSERLYQVKSSNETDTILYVNATGGIYVQPFQSLGEAQFIFTRQVFKLLSINDITDFITTTQMNTIDIQHDLPENDVSMLRSNPNKSNIFKSIGGLLDKLSRRLENPGLDVEVENLHNTTISDLLYKMAMLEREDLQKVYNEISGTSYKEETVRNLFLEALPQVGSREAALFVLDLIRQKRVSDITKVQLLTHLPFHVRKPDVELLVDLQALLNLPESIASEVQNTAILTYGTLIYKTCLIYCPYEMLDDYVRLYLDKFTDSKQYEKKMVWLEGLANIQLGKVVEFLEPIARGDSTRSRHLRFLAAWASMPTAPLRPDVIHPVYWPIFANRTEHLELRVAALTLLIVSSPSPNRLISLYWYMQGEPDQHLYNFFYTTLKSMERTNFPCYTHIGQIAAQFTRVLRKPLTKKRLVTGNYLIDYQDTYRHFGAMVQTVIIGNPVSNIPTVTYITLNNHGAGINLNQVSLYIKADGALAKIAPHRESGNILEVLKQFKIEQEPEKPVHVELIAQIQGKAVLCLHLNETNIKKGYKFLMDLTEYAYIFQNMAFHINQQRINVPLTMDSTQVTDLGTNARVSAIATSLFSMRGDFTYIPLGRNNHVILRTSIHGIEAIETYNPLTDLWYGAQRAQSIHAYFPVNITVGLDLKLFFSYITPAEHLTTGITAHVRTTTSIRGPKLEEKLRSMCANCTSIYTARKHPGNKPKGFTLLQLKTPELGGQLNVEVFDCDSHVSQDRLVADIMASHRSNYQIWPALKSGILGFHFMDYFTYVPPGGSCGLAAHIELYSPEPTEVKVEFLKSGKQSLISLTRRPVGSETVLQAWNVTILYEAVDWTVDRLKIDGSRTEAGKTPWKICVNAERTYPWEWSLLSNTPSSPSSVKLNVDWGSADTAEGNSSGSSISLNLRGEISRDQIQESESKIWPYDECRQQSEGKNFIPYSEACYQASRELSTLRKYEATIMYENLPKFLSKGAWRLRAFYDLIDGKSGITNRSQSDQLLISGVFPKGSSRGEMQVNNENVSLKLNPSIIDYFLTRTRLHKYWDNFLVQNFFSTCLVTPELLRSIYNVSTPIPQNQETLLLGHCHSNKPGFAITSKSDSSGLNFRLYQGTDEIKILSEGGQGSVYNNNVNLKLERNHEFKDILKAKKIRVGDNTVEILYTDIALFVYWTPDQVALLYPNYVLEFTCGLCANGNNEET